MWKRQGVRITVENAYQTLNKHFPEKKKTMEKKDDSCPVVITEM